MRLSDCVPDISGTRVKVVLGILAALLIAIAACVCWQLWKPAPRVVERTAVAQNQVDGSVVLAKTPDPEAKPKQLLPAGSVVERLVRVTATPTPVKAAHTPAAAQPAAPTASGALASSAAEQQGALQTAQAATPPATAEHGTAQPDTTVACPPVNIDLTLFRKPDGTRRVVASSDNGTVLGGADIPVEDAAPVPAPKLWAVGLSYDPFKCTGGLGVDRDFDPQGVLGWVRVGAEVNQSREGSIGNPGFRVSAKVRF